MIKTIIFLFLVYSVVYSTIVVTQPANNPFEHNEINYWYANFGEIHYGKPAVYKLIVLNQGFCNSTEYTKLQHFKIPTFVVINGDLDKCSFPTRALVAQNLGATGIIFSSKQVKYAIGNVVIQDDGQGRNVKINSLFIRPQTYNQLKTLKNIMIKVNFPIVQQQISDVRLFLTGSERKNYIFLRNFRTYYQELSSYINLDLVYHTIQCDSCSDKDCILQKQCCTFDLQNFRSGVGKQIIKQQFRQYNIFKYANKTNQLGIWFDYMNKFDQQCDDNWVNSAQCSQNIQTSLSIQQNMDLSDQYQIMNQWRRLQTKMGVFSHPELVVNGLRHTQSLTPISAYNMICQSLINPPSSCFGETQTPQASKVGLIVGLVIVGIVLILLGICCYRKIIRKQITNDMSSRVNELVAKYAAKVSDQKKKRKEKLMQKISEQI